VEAQSTSETFVVVMAYRYDKRVTCAWLTAAVAISLAFGIAVGVVSEDVGLR